MARDQLLHLVKQMNIDPTPPANNKQQGLKSNSRTLFDKSAAKPKPTATWSQEFSRAGRQLP